MNKTLNDLVREEAKKNVGCYNFCKNKEMRIIHHNICKRLVEIADEQKIPMGVLVYVAIGTNAHRPIVFSKGYLKVDEKKVERVFALCEIFAKKFGANTRTNDKVVHAISRYVDYNGGTLKFKQLVNALDEKEFSMKRIKTAKELAKLLCGEEAEYSKGGYITTIAKPTRNC